ncbi:MAG: Inositol transport system ATP-binding protein, partial [uncultured Pseudonocardia sp.]
DRHPATPAGDPRGLQAVRQRDRPAGHHHQRRRGRRDLRAGRQRRRQVHADQDLRGRAPARRRRVPAPGRARVVLLAPRGARRRHRDGLPGPRRREADAGVAQLLPRLGAPQGPRTPGPPGHRRDAEDRQGRAARHGHRPARHRPADRHAVRRRAAVRGDRPRRVLRGQGAHPRRAHRGPGGQAGGRGAQVRHPGPRARAGRRVHHPQPAPRLSRRRPVHAAQARPQPRRLREGRDHPRRADGHDGRRGGAGGAQPRAGGRWGRRRRGGRGAGGRGARAGHPGRRRIERRRTGGPPRRTAGRVQRGRRASV